MAWSSRTPHTSGGNVTMNQRRGRGPARRGAAGRAGARSEDRHAPGGPGASARTRGRTSRGGLLQGFFLLETLNRIRRNDVARRAPGGTRHAVADHSAQGFRANALDPLGPPVLGDIPKRLGDNFAEPLAADSVMQEEFREVFAVEIAVTVAVELQQSTGQLLRGNHLALADAAAKFDGKIQTSHVIFRYTTTRGCVQWPRRFIRFLVAAERLHRILRSQTPVGILVLAACASSTTPPDPAPVAFANIQWPAWTARGKELLQRLVAVDTSRPRGARRSAPETLQAFLRREAVETELLPVADGQWAVWGRVEAVEAQGPPVVLLSHLDTPSIDRAAWPRNAPPDALTVRDGRMWGAGVTGGKSVAVLHATSLAVLASVGGPRRRDVHMVALPDALDLSARSLDEVIRAIPAIATATVALTGGGFDIVDLLNDGDTVMAVTVGERATAVLQVAATTRSDGEGPTSSERLSRALVAVQRLPPRPRLTPTNRAFLRAASDALNFPQRVAAWTSVGALHLLVPQLLERPGVASQFIDEISTVRIEAGRSAESESPFRSRAFLRVGLLEDSNPGSIIRRLRTAIDDPDVHINVRAASPLSTSGAKTAWLGRIKQAARPSDDVTVVPMLGWRPQGADPLRSVGVPVFGFAPFTRDSAEFGQARPMSLRESDFRRAVERMATIVARLSAF